MMQVRGISFDYGHVLAGIDLAELAARIDRAGAVPAMRAAMPLAYRAHDEAIAAGAGHERGWRALMACLLEAAEVEPLRVDATIDELWAAQPTRNLWRAVPAEARALLRRLSDMHTPMVITSNSEGRVRELIEEVGIAEHFVAILDSGLLGFAKPDRRIFDRAAAALGLTTDQVVHVGDSESADVVGAKQAGAQTIRFDAFVPGAASRPTVADVRVDTFEQLEHVLLSMLSPR